jgi:uncharacterized protein YbjT (DUF2867 family)
VIDMVAETILVAGATGLIGQPVARQLHQDGFQVRVLVRDARRARARLGPDLEYVEGDVEDAAVVERAVDGCSGVHVSLGSRGTPPLHMVAASDFAHMVSRAFHTPEAANRDFFIHGPEALTIPAALGLYCKLVEPGTRVVTVPLGIMSLADRLVMGGRLRANLQLMRLLQRLGERGDPSEAASLLGAPSATVGQWCRQQTGAARQQPTRQP